MATVTVNAADPASKVIYQFTDVGSLANAIQNYQFIPVRSDGSPFKVQEFEGGYLLDGAPLNVWFGLGWYTGQQALLQPLWANGTIPTPPQAQLTAQVVAMPTGLATQTAAYLAQASSGLFGLSWPVLIGLAAVGFMAFNTMGHGGGHSRASEEF